MIRPAVTADMPALLEMGQAFNEEAGYAESVPFDSTSFAYTLAVLGEAGLLFVVEHEGRVVGMAACDVAPSICNQTVRIGREAFWYIVDGFRKGEYSKALLAALECAARDRGAAFFDVVAEDGKRSEALARLYRAASFRPTERTFRKALQCP